MLEKKFDSEEVIEEFEALTKETSKVQEKKVFFKQMEAQCIHNKLGLNGKNDPETFKACVPLSLTKNWKLTFKELLMGSFSSSQNVITTISLSEFPFGNGKAL